MVRRVSAQHARDNFGELIGSVHYSKEPVIVERKGKPFAVLLSFDDFEEFRAIRAAQDWEVIDRQRDESANLDRASVELMIAEEITAFRAEDQKVEKRAG